jgi:hypothetical protein
MVPIVLSAPAVFGGLFVFGMIATGLALALGLFTRAALLAGMWFSLNNLLMGFGAGGVHHSINSLMLVLEIGFLWTGAWRPYSLDSLFFASGARPAWRRAAI